MEVIVSVRHNTFTGKWEIHVNGNYILSCASGELASEQAEDLRDIFAKWATSDLQALCAFNKTLHRRNHE